MFYTRVAALETKAIVEALIIECNIVKNTRKPRGLGYGVVPLFFEDLPLSVELLKGSPRDVIKSVADPAYQPPTSGPILYFEMKPTPHPLTDLMPLLPDLTLLGQSDSLPGLVGNRLPLRVEDLGTRMKVVSEKTIYAHHIRIASMNEVESSFNAFLKDWRKFTSTLGTGISDVLDPTPP